MIKIVAIDDNRVNLTLLKAMLSESFDFRAFKNPQKGLNHILNNHTDLVISDLMMPDMNGIELTKAIKKHNPDIPVVIVSAFDDRANIEEAYKAGANDYMTKPFNLSLFQKKIKSLTSKALIR
jgi:two-component system response regulator YesN